VYNKYIINNSKDFLISVVVIIMKIKRKMISKADLRLGAIVLTAVMVGLAVHQVVVAPRLAKRVKAA
jgi:hypothetical protein